MNYFYYLLNVHKFSDITLGEVHIAELLGVDSSPFKDDIAIAKLRKYKWD